MYGYGNPAFAPAYGSPAGYGAMAPYGGYGMTAFGAGAEGETTTDMIKRKLDEKTAGVENKYWLGGALVGLTLWYGATHRWF